MDERPGHGRDIGRPQQSGSSSPPTPLSFRQGDVLLLAVAGFPPGLRFEPRSGRIVLAEGEATGHAHAIEDPEARTFTYAGQRDLLTRSKAQLIHEEHAPIEVPPGVYRIVIQREYEPSAGSERPWREVAD